MLIICTLHKDWTTNALTEKTEDNSNKLVKLPE